MRWRAFELRQPLLARRGRLLRAPLPGLLQRMEVTVYLGFQNPKAFMSEHANVFRNSRQHPALATSLCPCAAARLLTTAPRPDEAPPFGSLEVPVAAPTHC